MRPWKGKRSRQKRSAVSNPEKSRLRTTKPSEHRRRRGNLRCAASTLLLLVGTGCVRPGPTVTTQRTHPPATHSYVLGIVREGWHTAIILPVGQLTGPLASIRDVVPHAPFIGIGWGNRRYYRARHPSVLAGVRALFPSRSVLHVTARSRKDLIAQGRARHLYWIAVAAPRWRRLQSFLLRSFTRGPRGAFVIVGPRTRHGDFFASSRTYDAWHTCNTWTAAALRIIGFHEQAPVLFAGQVTAGLTAFRAPRRSPKAPPPTLLPTRPLP